MDILILSLALSADAFGAALAVGMRRIGLVDKIKLSAAVGFMHILLPFISMTIGSELFHVFGDWLFSAGGIVLLLTGLQMILAFFKEEEKQKPMGLGILLFSFGVSMDSFSTGLSLGVLGLDKQASVISFGLCAGMMTMGGLILSSKMSGAVGKAGEAAGGILLLVMGIKWLLA